MNYIEKTLLDAIALAAAAAPGTVDNVVVLDTETLRLPHEFNLTGKILAGPTGPGNASTMKLHYAWADGPTAAPLSAAELAAAGSFTTVLADRADFIQKSI